MKDKLIVTILLAAFALPASAQFELTKDNRHEISIGYGFHAVSGDDFDLDFSFMSEVDKIGAFHAAYTRFLDSIVGIGVTYCYDPRIINYYDFPYPKGIHICTLDESSHSIMAHAKFNCFRYKFLLLYGKFDAGICFWDYRLQEYHPENYEIQLPDQRCCFAWQAAFGVEAGIGNWGLFVQTGIGMEGIMSLGINYRFKNK
ncbi:MAG: hypothetical protein IJQ11_02710 [Bacteroidales bacterium]|nr:hypothetical protein [Bacteroidales bacterium]